MVALLFLITPLSCTSLAFGFYFRVVVTIRVRTLWLSHFWFRLDHLIKPCFCLLHLCSHFTLRSLSLTSPHAHYESLHHSLPPASLAHLHTPMHTYRHMPSCTLLTLARASHAPLTTHSHRALCASLYPCVHPLST
jgi:hypothetical protein